MKSKEEVDALFQYAAEGILVVNGRGDITKINPSALKLFGFQLEEIVGKKIECLIPDRYASHHVHNRENYTHEPHARSMGTGMELFGLKKDGSEFPVEVSLSPYPNEHGNFVIAFVVDITMRKLAEEKLKNYSAELEKQVKNRTLILEEAIEELKKTRTELRNSLSKEMELSELKTRFVSMASHEFRTPLTTMLSSLSLLTKYAEQNDRENQTKHANRIKNSIHNLTDILNDFLSLSKLEEGRIENQPEELNLKEFIREVHSEMQLMTLRNQKIAYTHTGISNVTLDKKLLKNILFNLISNAIKFSPDGGNIEISSHGSNAVIKISVKDSGIGIPVSDQKHLFERFFRANNATNIQGTGLGLSIVSKYIELIHGTIHFESTENQGTTFTVLIPQ
jgi:PAS domain S-box-containing protein